MQWRERILGVLSPYMSVYNRVLAPQRMPYQNFERDATLSRCSATPPSDTARWHHHSPLGGYCCRHDLSDCHNSVTHTVNCRVRGTALRSSCCVMRGEGNLGVVSFAKVQWQSIGSGLGQHNLHWRRDSSRMNCKQAWGAHEGRLRGQGDGGRRGGGEGERGLEWRPTRLESTEGGFGEEGWRGPPLRCGHCRSITATQWRRV